MFLYLISLTLSTTLNLVLVSSISASALAFVSIFSVKSKLPATRGFCPYNHGKYCCITLRNYSKKKDNIYYHQSSFFHKVYP